MVLKNLKTSMMALLMVSCAAYADEKSKDTSLSAFMKSVGAGSLAGMVEVLVNQPQVFFKNGLQRGDSMQKMLAQVKQSPKVLYAGLGVGMTCMVPTTAAQVGFNEALTQVMPGDDTATAVTRNAVAGGLSALLSNPAELVVNHQQQRQQHNEQLRQNQKNLQLLRAQQLNTQAWSTIKELHEQHGAKVVMRGFTGKVLRDSPFCAGFLTAYPKAKELYAQHNSDAQPWQATLAATAAVGPVITVVTHPFDTLSTKMQAEPAKPTMQVLADATKDGWESLIKGVVPRTARVMVAIPLMSAVKDAVQDALKND